MGNQLCKCSEPVEEPKHIEKEVKKPVEELKQKTQSPVEELKQKTQSPVEELKQKTQSLHPIHIEYSLNTKTKRTLEQLTFGVDFTDHMYERDWDMDHGWGPPRIVPYHDLQVSPANSCFNYCLEVFEGMKAFYGVDGKIRLFRPELNLARLRNSAKRICLPDFNEKEVLEYLKTLVALDKDWIPKKRGYSLYIRPVLVSTHPYVGISVPKKVKMYIICCPVGAYFPKAVKLICDKEHSRSWPGGTGNVKFGGNYGSVISIMGEAKSKGYDEILWMEKKSDEWMVTEVGAMNMFFFWKNEQGEEELITAPLEMGTVLPGVTRSSVLGITRKWGEFKVTEREYSMREVVKAFDEGRVIEAFGCGTAAVCSAVQSITFDDKEYDLSSTIDQNTQKGKLASRIQNTLLDIYYGVVEHEWQCIVDCNSETKDVPIPLIEPVKPVPISDLIKKEKNQDLIIERTFYGKPRRPDKDIRWGVDFSDHMYERDWSQDEGWYNPRISPNHDFLISPAASSFNYGLSVFEGMKAFCGNDGKIRLFRPELNLARLRDSAKRICLPDFDDKELLEHLKILIRIDKEWIPKTRGYSFYIRPVIISTYPFVGVSVPKKVKLYIICCPVGIYFPKAVKLICDKEHSRAWPGGTGNVKFSGNYGSVMAIMGEAKSKGYDDLLWIEQKGDEWLVTEVGSMNFFLFWKNEQGEEELITAPLEMGTVLPGVTRSSVLGITRKWGEFKVTEREYSMREVVKAFDEGRVIEAFGCGTAVVCTGVLSITFEEKLYDLSHTIDQETQKGKLALRIYNTLLDIYYGEKENEWAIIVE